MSEALEVVGAGLVITGVAFIFWPAALILGGGALLAAGYLAGD